MSDRKPPDGDYESSLSAPLVGTPASCDLCKHFRTHVVGMTCDAFPDGIPDVIGDGDWDHRVPLGDETVLFELADDATPEEIANLELSLSRFARNYAGPLPPDYRGEEPDDEDDD